jgi:hypothetical protein
MLSSLANTSITEQKILSKTEKSGKNKDTSEKYFFNKTTIEAIFSQLANDFQCESVVFLASEFKFLTKEVKQNYLQIFAREIHLEILFEHLTAPNAP